MMSGNDKVDRIVCRYIREFRLFWNGRDVTKIVVDAWRDDLLPVRLCKWTEADRVLFALLVSRG